MQNVVSHVLLERVAFTDATMMWYLRDTEVNIKDIALQVPLRFSAQSLRLPPV